jgi:hypothetical protein
LIVEALKAMDKHVIAQHPLTARLEQAEIEAPEADEGPILERIQRDRAKRRTLIAPERATEITALERAKRR